MKKTRHVYLFKLTQADIDVLEKWFMFKLNVCAGSSTVEFTINEDDPDDLGRRALINFYELCKILHLTAKV